MSRHPFAVVESTSASEHSVFESDSEHASGNTSSFQRQRARARSVPAKLRPPVKTESVPRRQTLRRPPRPVYIEDPAFSLRLDGLDASLSQPVYERHASVEGSITFVNPSNIIRAEVKVEGFVRVYEYTGWSAKTSVLSELLVFWDAPNRMGGYGGGTSSSSSSGAFFPSPGTCPESFAFKTNMPTHYTERDGSVTPLPPSFAESVAGIQAEVSYEFVVYLTRVHDMRPIKSVEMCGKWRRKSVARHTFLYRPRSRPSKQGPFPPSSRASLKNPVTRFYSAVEPSAPYSASFRTLLYLPASQVTPLRSPIPFYLKLYGPEWITCAFSRPDLSSFLPSPRSKLDDFRSRTICGALSEQMTNLQLNFSRLLDLGSASLNGFTRIFNDDAESSHSSQHSLYEKSTSTKRHRTTSSPKVRVALIRQVSVDTWDDVSEARNKFSEFVEEGSGDGRVVKNLLLGEGTMYTAEVTQGSITWAGEVAIGPALDVQHGGFRTNSITVQDLLFISIKDPTSGASSTFHQTIPLQLTTDPYEAEME